MGSGLVREVHVKTGDRVRRGDRLIQLDNFELAELLFRYQSLQAQRKNALLEEDLAEKVWSRSAQLLELEAIPASENEAAETRSAQATASVRKIDSELNDTAVKLRRLGVDPGRASPDSPENGAIPTDTIRSPIAGVVTAVEVAPSESILSSDVLAEVVDLREVWVLADVYEKDLGQIALRKPAEVRVSTYPNRSFPGTVTAISDVLDEKTRTAKVRVEVDNPQLELKLNMFATVWVPTREVVQALVVPDSAIQLIEGKECVFVRVGEGVFERRSITTGRTVDHQVEILDGVRSGEQVVAQGSFLLKSTLLRDQIGGHEH